MEKHKNLEWIKSLRDHVLAVIFIGIVFLSFFIYFKIFESFFRLG